MAKVYFLAPNWDIPPGTLIDLGHLISDPRDPTFSLNASSRQYIPEELIHTSIKRDWNAKVDRTSGGKLGVWATFLNTLGLGGDIGVEASKSAETEISVKTLETRFFQPDKRYIEESLKEPNVTLFIESTIFRKPIYLVTGVKIARGAKISQLEARRKKIGGHVGVDVAGVTVGPGAEVSREGELKESFEGSDDFVLAYRLWKIKAKRSGDVSWKQNRGEGQMLDGGVIAREKFVVEDFREIEIEELDGDSEVVDGWDEMDNEDCSVVI